MKDASGNRPPNGKGAAASGDTGSPEIELAYQLVDAKFEYPRIGNRYLFTSKGRPALRDKRSEAVAAVSGFLEKAFAVIKERGLRPNETMEQTAAAMAYDTVEQYVKDNEGKLTDRAGKERGVEAGDVIAHLSGLPKPKVGYFYEPSHCTADGEALEEIRSPTTKKKKTGLGHGRLLLRQPYRDGDPEPDHNTR